MSKKRNRRNNEKYPALKPELNLKTRSELLDYDYIDQLSPEEKDWLNRFTEEYTNANFNHKGKKIDKKDSSKKDSYDRNNARNRCILTKVKASGKLVDNEKIQDIDKTAMSPEEQLILKEELNLVKQRKNRNNRKNNSK